MKNSMSQGKVRIIALSITIILFVVLIAICNAFLTGDIVNHYESRGDIYSWSWIHCSLVTLIVLLFIASAVLLIWEMFDDEDSPLEYFYEDYEKEKGDVKKKPIRKVLTWAISLILLCWGGGKTSNIYNEMIFMYNKSKLYHNTYQQKIEEKKGFYDKLWKTYLSKEKITNINKETFITVTKVIMENRKDGQAITWKWVKENQQIPYDEFTKFYADLSTFIETQREGYFNIEKECQLISNKNNTLLDTFPNNIYNRVLKCKPIKFEYGITSDSTEAVFTSKKENLK